MIRRWLSIMMSIAVLTMCAIPVCAESENSNPSMNPLYTDPTFLTEASVVETSNGVKLIRNSVLPTRNAGQRYRQETVELITENPAQQAELLSYLASESGDKSASGMDGGYTVETYSTIYYTLLYNNNEGLAVEVTFESVEGGYNVRSSQVQVVDHWLSIDYLGDNTVGLIGYEVELDIMDSEWEYTMPSNIATTQNISTGYFNAGYTVTIERGQGSWDYTLRNYIQFPL